MEEPFFGITTVIDCTKAYEKSKELGVTFFSYYLHKTLVAVNEIESFRYRIIDGDIYVFDQIDASATILREDNTFGFSLMKFDNDLSVFSENIKTEIERVKKTSGIITRDFEINLIHFSALPWINFTAYSHARSYTWPDSCPKISFGKMDTNEGKKTMPLSVHVHHGLLDGYHVGEFVNLFQNLMNS
jgi:chloramphenicol O-acetyltransferase type A